MTDKLNPEEQFDFWLGDWHVTWGENQHGTNQIRKILDGKAIQENFDGNPSLPFRGMSLSVYDKKNERWRQTWVDNEGNYWDFIGSFEDERMVLATEDEIEGQKVMLRMVFYNISSDDLDWNWESSRDNGQTWQLKWQIHYKRQKAQDPVPDAV